MLGVASNETVLFEELPLRAPPLSLPTLAAGLAVGAMGGAATRRTVKVTRWNATARWTARGGEAVRPAFPPLRPSGQKEAELVHANVTFGNPGWGEGALCCIPFYSIFSVK